MKTLKCYTNFQGYHFTHLEWWYDDDDDDVDYDYDDDDDELVMWLTTNNNISITVSSCHSLLPISTNTFCEQNLLLKHLEIQGCPILAIC